MGYDDRRYGRDRGYAQDRGGYDRGFGGDTRSERGYDRGGYDRDRGGARYGSDRDPRGYDYDDRGFFDRAGDEVRSWFGDDDAERRRRADERHYREQYERDRREWERSGGRGYPPSASAYAGVGADGFGLGVPPLAGPYGYGMGGGYGDERDPGYRSSGADRYRGDQGYRRSEGQDRSFTGREQDRDQDRHDQTYRSWRDRQMESFDRDYDDYRREHQSKFDSDFGSWRQTREGQRGHLKQAREHQEVVGSDGTHIGTVDHVRGDRILLTKTDKDAGGHHHSIPVGWIESVDDKVKINKTADEAKRLWRDEEQNSAILGNNRQPGQGSQGQGAQGQGTQGQTGGAQGSEGPHALDRSFSGTY